MVAWLALAACTGDPAIPPQPADGPQDTGQPPIPITFVVSAAWEANVDGAQGIGTVVVTSSVATTVAVAVDDGSRSWILEGAGSDTEHQIQVLGLAADRAHTLTVTATDPQGTERQADPLEVTTEALPEDFPPFTVTAMPDQMEPGLTLAMFGPYLAMVDEVGVVRWYLYFPEITQLDTVTERGTIYVHIRKTVALELSMTGAVVSDWRAAQSIDPGKGIAVDVLSLHHDLVDLPSGNLLGLSIERRWFIDYPSSSTLALAPPEDAWVAGDVVVEFQRDGTVVNRWPLLDRLDPYRVVHDGIRGDHWEAFFGGDDIKDWSHGNAVWFDAARDEVVVSLRHQDAVVALDHGSGDVRWIFAPDAHWGPPWDALVLQPAAPSLVSAYHQHGASITNDGTLMMFDNGNGRASAFEPQLSDLENTSRGLEVQLDPKTGTWDAAWSYVGAFSGSLGSCDALPQSGNALVTFGNVKDPDQDGVQVIETTRADPPQVVFSLHIAQPATSYRARRVSVPGF